MGLFDILGAVLSPVKDIINKREDRKQAHQAANAALSAAQQENATKIELSDQQLEHILAGGLGTSWKDEYVTVSVVGIINATMLGGILAAFGYDGFIKGVVLGVNTLVTVGVDVGFILNAVIMAAIGLSIWRKV